MNRARMKTLLKKQRAITSEHTPLFSQQYPVLMSTDSVQVNAVKVT